MNTTEFFKERFDRMQALNGHDSGLESITQKAFTAFNRMGIPAGKNEEWKYTRISSLFSKPYEYEPVATTCLSPEDIADVRLPGHESATELVFVNGIYQPSLSAPELPAGLTVMRLEEAAGRAGYSEIISAQLGHSANYQRDGINALNTAFAKKGLFIAVAPRAIIEQPVYIYNIADARESNLFSQPRVLVHVAKQSQVSFVQSFATVGRSDAFANEIMEVVVEQDARFDYYKIQDETANSHQVSTTHIRQTGKSFVHAVTISLNGGMIRNNLNIVMGAEYCESHLYGLYFQQGQSHVDNHTVVDNVMPHCFSNQLYKGILDGNATGVFNGKIFVQPNAQKTNAYQSNKNILLSDDASVNTKPQLEIFADDVKCSHGCTVGQLDEEGMFYLQSRGITEKNARALLLHAYADDILEKIGIPVIRTHIDNLISKRLEFDMA